VYLITGFLVIGWTYLAFFTIMAQLWLLPVTSMLGPAVLFVDARLMGRMAWLLNYRTPEPRRPRKPSKVTAEEEACTVNDPGAVPPEIGPRPTTRQDAKNQTDLKEEEFEDVEEADDADFLPVTGYGLAKDEPPPPPPASLHLGDYETVAVKPDP